VLLVAEDCDEGIAHCRCAGSYAAHVDLLKAPVLCAAIVPRVEDRSGGIAIGKVLLLTEDRDERIARGSGAGSLRALIDLLEVPAIDSAVVPRILNRSAPEYPSTV